MFEFVADADAEIVRGLIAILERLYSGQRAKEVAAFDVEGFFGRIGLGSVYYLAAAEWAGGDGGEDMRESAKRIGEGAM